MPYKRLYIFVEGVDDKEFFSKIITTKIKRRYNDVQIVSYAQLKRQKVANWIKSVKGGRWDYYFITDINQAPCVTEKKTKLKPNLKILI